MYLIVNQPFRLFPSTVYHIGGICQEDSCDFLESGVGRRAAQALDPPRRTDLTRRLREMHFSFLASLRVGEGPLCPQGVGRSGFLNAETQRRQEPTSRALVSCFLKGQFSAPSWPRGESGRVRQGGSAPRIYVTASACRNHRAARTIDNWRPPAIAGHGLRIEGRIPENGIPQPALPGGTFRSHGERGTTARGNAGTADERS
jgi:hypothetical protein